MWVTEGQNAQKRLCFKKYLCTGPKGAFSVSQKIWLVILRTLFTPVIMFSKAVCPDSSRCTVDDLQYEGSPQLVVVSILDFLCTSPPILSPVSCHSL